MLSPLSGYETCWNPQKWNVNTQNNNCYVYALNNHNSKYTSKQHPNDEVNVYTCNNIVGAMKREGIEMYPTTFEEKCIPNYRKIYIAISDNPKKDFHYYRQECDGMWSHKRGVNPPTRHDANGQYIFNPRQISKNYNILNYNVDCGFHCIHVNSEKLKI